MSELPAGWTHFALKDIGGLSGGKTPSKAAPKFWSSPDVPWVSPKDMKRDLLSDSEDKISNAAVDQAGMTLYPANSVLMVTRSGILQHTFPVSMAGAALTVNQDIKVLRPIEGINPKYSFHLLKGFGSVILTRCSKAGTTVQSVDSEKLEALMLPLPPLAEQTRIAQKLDELLAQVDTLKARIDTIPALLKRFRQSVLAAAVSGRLTEEWREARCLPETSADLLAHTKAEKLSWVTENSDHNEAKRVFKRASGFDAGRLEAHSLPDGWCWAGLEDVVLLVVDCHNKTAPYQEAGVALVRTTNIRDGAFLWEDLRHVSEETYAYWSRRCVPEPGDIVFTREAPMGEAAIIPPSTKLCLGQRTMLFRCVNGGTSAGYLLLTLLDPVFKARSEDIAVGTGVKHFRVGDVSDLKIPVAPKEEQTEIVRRVEQLFAFADQLEAKVATAQARLDRLTQSILAKAFRGELVPQDPNDEPASLLLKRIQAQRAAAPKAKRGRKTA